MSQEEVWLMKSKGNPSIPLSLQWLTFFVDTRSSVKHSSGSPGENAWPGELQPDGECMVMPGTRLGVFFATCLAGRGRGSVERIFLSVTRKLMFWCDKTSNAELSLINLIWGVLKWPLCREYTLWIKMVLIYKSMSLKWVFSWKEYKISIIFLCIFIHSTVKQ